MRLVCLLAFAVALVGCGSSGSDTVKTSETSTSPTASSPSANPGSTPSAAPAGNPDAPVSSAPPAGHSADDGHNHGGETKSTDPAPASATGPALTTTDVEGDWSGTGPKKEGFSMQIKANMSVTLTVAQTGSPTQTFTGRWELDKDAVIMHLLTVTVADDKRDIHTDLVWKMEDGKLALQGDPSAGRVILSRKG